MVITADKHGRADSCYHTLITKINSKYPIVLVNWVEDFVFNEELLKLKEYILIDFREFGWSYDLKDSHIFGTDNALNEQYGGEEWTKFNEWVRANPYKCLFQRELLKKDFGGNIYSIEYPNLQPEYPVQTKEEFDNRPITAFFYFGRSHEARLVLHANIWKHSVTHGYSVCDNVFQFNDYMHHERESKKMVSLHLPHYARLPISEILKINGMSKFSISLPGSGIDCFRNSESCVNSIMILPEDGKYWTYSWVDGVNCIRFSRNNDVTGLKNEWDVLGKIEESLQREDLYDIYLNSLETASKYRVDKYISNYIEPIINLL